MFRITIVICFATIALFSCDRVKNSTKNAIDKTAESAGKVGSDIVTNIGTGVEKSIQSTAQLSDALQQAGVKTGKLYYNQNKIGNENILSMYLIFEKDFVKIVKVKAIDEAGIEYGRTALMIRAKKDSASYFDFKFNERVNLEHKSKFIFE